jgi:hypothetical protein
MVKMQMTSLALLLLRLQSDPFNQPRYHEAEPLFF